MMINARRVAFIVLIVAELALYWAWKKDLGDFTLLGLLITTGFIWGALELFKLSGPVWWMAIFGAVLDAAAAVFELYSKINLWDLLMHGWGGLVIGAAALELIRRHGKQHGKEQGRLFVITAVLLITLGVGFLYEFLEYLVDKFQYGEPHTLVSAYDSIEDQLMNLFGALLALVIRGRKLFLPRK